MRRANPLAVLVAALALTGCGPAAARPADPAPARTDRAQATPGGPVRVTSEGDGSPGLDEGPLPEAGNGREPGPPSPTWCGTPWVDR